MTRELMKQLKNLAGRGAMPPAFFYTGAAESLRHFYSFFHNLLLF